MERRRESPARGRTAAILVLVLTVLQTVRLTGTDQGTWLRVLGAAVALLGVATVAALWCRRCVEASLVALVVASGSGLGAALAMVRGVPGQDPTGLTPAGIAMVFLAVAVVLAILVRTPRRKAARTGPDPYA
jgi:hypothetical protein